MLIKEGASLQGLSIQMRPALISAERIWKKYGRSEGVTVTSGTDGCHSAGSLHYYGYGLDFRIRYFSEPIALAVSEELSVSLSSISDKYQVILLGDHIHVEYDITKN